MSHSKTFVRKGATVERGYQAVYTYETYHPQTSDNDKWLECRAKVPMYAEKRIGVRINVTCKILLLNGVICKKKGLGRAIVSLEPFS